MNDKIFTLAENIYFLLIGSLSEKEKETFIVDDPDNKGQTKNTEKGSVLYYQIEDQLIGNSKLIVKRKSVYGIEHIYPICEKSKLVVQLLDDKKTLTRKHIEILKQLGFDFQHEEIKI